MTVEVSYRSREESRRTDYWGLDDDGGVRGWGWGGTNGGMNDVMPVVFSILGLPLFPVLMLLIIFRPTLRLFQSPLTRLHCTSPARGSGNRRNPKP